MKVTARGARHRSTGGERAPPRRYRERHYRDGYCSHKLEPGCGEGLQTPDRSPSEAGGRAFPFSGFRTSGKRLASRVVVARQSRPTRAAAARNVEAMRSSKPEEWRPG